MKTKFYLFLTAILLVVACSKEDAVRVADGTFVDATIQGVYNTAISKISYTPNDDKSVFSFSWNLADEISVLIPATGINDNQLFKAAATSSSTVFTGGLASWTGKETVCAVYPYANTGYSYSSSTSSILVDQTNQTIDASANDRLANTLMLATSDNASVSDDGEVSIPDLSFKQAMSIFQLELTNIPTDQTITEMGFECEDSVFNLVSQVSVSSAEILSTSAKSNSVSGDVENHVGTTAKLNLSVLPVDLTGKSITLYVKTRAGVVSRKYSKTFSSGLNFARANMLYSTSGALNLTSDFTATILSEFDLASFTSTNYPSSDTWVIIDEVAASAEDFDGLKEAISTCVAAGRSISLEFPNLKVLTVKALYQTKIASVDMPLVTIVDEYAFYQCTTLKSVSLLSLLGVGGSAFYGCTSLESVSLPLLTSVSASAFYGCTSLESVSLPLVTSVGGSAFYGCTSLESVSLPLVTSVGNYAFRGCTSLESVSLPLVTSVGYFAFYGCTSLESVSLPLVTSLGYNAFYGCTSLESVSLPLLTSVGSSAFYGCTSLESVSLPLLTSVSGSAFDGCTSLESVSLPLLTSVSSSAFYGCTSLESITLPLVKSVGSSAFGNCTLLKTVSLPSCTTLYANFQNTFLLESLELATVDGCVLSSIDEECFLYNGTTSIATGISLTVGSGNKDYVSGNTLTVGDFSREFKIVLVNGEGSDGSTSGSGESGNGSGW